MKDSIQHTAYSLQRRVLLFAVCALLFAAPIAPAQAQENCCVYEAIGTRELHCNPGTTTATCEGIDGVFFQDCSPSQCDIWRGENEEEAAAGGSVLAPRMGRPAPTIETGAGAVRQLLKNVAEERGAGYAPSPNFAAVAGRVVRVALTLVGLVFFALTIYGGALYLTAGGNEEQVKKATSTIARSIIGLLIVIFAGAITQFIVRNVAPAVRAPTPGGAPARVDTSFFGSCPEGYSYAWTANDPESGGLGAECVPQ